MNTIYLWFQNNLDIVFFIYGLSFLIMGVVILVQPKERSEFKIANILWLLAAFGITHGINELLDMWAIIKNRHPSLDLFRWLILIISYIFLFEFGRRLFYMVEGKSSAWYKNGAKWLSPVIGLFILTLSLKASDYWVASTTLARYLLGLPGGVLTGFGLFLYYKHEKELLEPLKVKKYCYLGGAAFLIYAALGGTVVPKGNFFPSNWLNTDSFFLAVKIPVQAFRAICAITATWAIGGMLTIFNWEIRNNLQKARDTLKQQLGESEARYMEIVENSTDIIYSLDAGGLVGYANRNGCQLLGFSKAELIGKHIRNLLAPETWKDLDKAIGRLKQEGMFFISNGKIIKKDGKNLDVVLHSMALYDNKRNFYGMRLTIRDITKLKKVEQEYKCMIDTNMDGFWVVDAKGNFLDVNKTYCDAIGYRRDELLKMGIKDIEAVESSEDVVKHMQKQSEVGYDRFETKHRRKDGKIIDVEVSSNYMDIEDGRFYVFLRDISDKKAAQKSMMERERFLSSVFSSIQDNLCVTDTHLNIMRVNPTMERKFSHSMPLVGKKCYEAFHERSEPCEDCPTLKTLETGNTSVSVVSLKDHDGEIIGWYEVYTFPLKAAETDNFIGVIEYGRDITERKKAEKELLRMDKLSSLGRMMAEIGHEIKNPLAGIAMMLMSMLNKFEEEDVRYRDIMKVLDKIGNLEKLLDNIVRFSKPKPPTLEIVDISVPLENSLFFVKKALRDKKITVEKVYHDNNVKILADAESLQQVFINLFLNAVESMNNNGLLNIDIYEIEEDQNKEPQAFHGNLIESPTHAELYVKVIIKDTGCGIKKEHLDKIFDPYFTTNPEKTGLGLYITHQIISAHKGRINFYSNEGEGTSCVVTIPLFLSIKG